MGLQGKPQAGVILHHMGAGAQFGQRHLGLGAAVLLGHGGEERQGRIGRQALDFPERAAPLEPHGAVGVGPRQASSGGGLRPGPAPEGEDIGIAVAAAFGELCRLLLAQALDLPETQAQGEAAALARLFAHASTGLQGAVPKAVVDVDRTDLHPVIAGIAHDLGRGIEAHGLTVQQRAGEDRRIAAFHPGRDVDQKGEAGGVAFRKAIGAETLDLLEAAFGEIALIAARHHAADQLFAELVDIAAALEGRHGAAQLVGLFRA